MSTALSASTLDRRGDRPSLPPAHDLRVVAAGEGRSDPGGARRGRLLLYARRQALPGLQQPADVLERRPLAPEGGEGDPGAGGGPRLREPVPRHRAARAARREARRARSRRHRRLLLHERRRRGQRERDPRGARRDRAPQGAGALSLVPRRHGRGDLAHRRPAPLGGRAGAAGHRARPRVPQVGAQGAGAGRGEPARARGRDPLRGRREHRGVPDGNGGRHERAADPAGRLPPGRARDLRPPRHPADRGRGDVGLRAHRRVVRGRPLEGRARHHHDGQGHHVRLRAARRRRPAPADRQGVPGARVPGRPHLQQPPARLRDGTRDDRGLRGRGPARERPTHGQDPAPAHARAREEASLRRGHALDRPLRHVRAGAESEDLRDDGALRRHLGRDGGARPLSSARTGSTPSCAGTPSSPTRRSRSPRRSSRRVSRRSTRRWRSRIEAPPRGARGRGDRAPPGKPSVRWNER